MMLTITDTAGTSGTVTTDKDTVADAIRGWYPDAPDDVTAALDELQTALDWGDQAKVGDLAVALGITIDRGFTVQIDAGDAVAQIWQSVAPSENVVDWDGDQKALAEYVAGNQTYIDRNDPDDSHWRVRVWNGADADTSTEPAAEWYSDIRS